MPVSSYLCSEARPMKYGRSVRYLESFLRFGIKPGLSRTRHLLKILGNPHTKFRSVHVAGTNGKGSVCAMAASVLAAAGLRAGLYTSPHLKEYTERIKINGRDISRRAFADAVQKVRHAVKNLYRLKELPTEFELLTAAAFVYFAGQKADIVVVETGRSALETLEESVVAGEKLAPMRRRVYGDTAVLIYRWSAGGES